VKVVVIGAGVIGAAVADALAVRGVRVTVIDMRAPGRGATQASAGLLAPFIEAHDERPLLDLAVRSLAQYDAFVGALRERSGCALEYARTGTLEVAFTDDEADRLRAAQRALTGRGVTSEWIDATALRRVEPAVSEAAIAGLLIPAHGFVGAGSLMKALLQSARMAGASFEQPVEAVRIDQSIDQSGDRVDVTAGNQSYTADWAVVAAGSWSSRVRVTGARTPVVRPIRGQLLHLGWTGPRPARSVWGAACYTVPWSDGSLLVGATVEDVGFDEHSTVGGVSQLMNAVRRLLPASALAAVDAVRVGLRPATSDGLPWIGPLAAAPRVVMATGHYRNGVLLAPLTADLVTRLIVLGESDPALAVTSPDRATGASYLGS
jgi:glycine oxidase